MRAIADAPSLSAALARIDAARAAVRGAGAARLPSIDASRSVTREEGNAALAGGAAPPGTDFGRTTFNSGVTASWDADLFGRLRASSTAASARLDAVTADAAAVRLALRSDIAVAVIDARSLAERDRVIAEDLASARDLVAVTRVRTRAGIAPGFDLVRAESLEADALARQTPIAGERALILGRLVTLTGLSAQDVLAMLALPGGTPLTAHAPATLPSALLRARPDIVAAEYRLAAADAEIAGAAAERFPRLTISATLGMVALGLGDLFDSDALVGSLGAGIAGPLFDFGRVAARIDARQADARVAFADYRGVVFRALGETESALGVLGARDARVAAIDRRVTLDSDTLNLARERYRRGLDSFLTVIDAQRTRDASRSLLVDARADAERARIALYRAVGGSPAERP